MPLSPQQRRPAPLPSFLRRQEPRRQEPNLAIVNPRPTPAHPNNPEQIRTNLNKPEHRQAPRPDRTAPRIAPEHPEKKNKP